MKRQLMAEQWDAFARSVFTQPNISAVQKQEMRRAFYAGAQAILFKVIAVLAPDTEPTDADMEIMFGLEQELQDFAKLIKEGRA